MSSPAASGSSLARRWPILLSSTRFLSLFSVALLTGILVDFWAFIIPALARLDAQAFVRMTQELDRDYLVPIPLLYFVVNLSATAFALLLLSRRPTAAFWLSAAALVCCLALTASTLLVNVPINGEVLNTWSASNPPSDWQQTRDRWNAAHTFRTSMAVGALALQLIAVLLPFRQTAARSRSM